MRILSSLSLMLMLAAPISSAQQTGPDDFTTANGRTLMDAVYERHEQYPYVYEEQSMILIDRFGNKETRTLKRYSRVENNGTINFLLLFDSPKEVAGVAILATRLANGLTKQSFFLPALGYGLIASNSNHVPGQVGDNFLGTDYSIEDLTGEILDDYQHIRRDDTLIDEIPYFVVDAFVRSASSDQIVLEQVLPVRRHYIRKDNLYISQTEHFDNLGRLRKRQSNHDLQPVHGDMWRANMMLMDDDREQHRTVIKIDRRVFSADYVPEEVFTSEWLIRNSPKEYPEETSEAEVSS